MGEHWGHRGRSLFVASSAGAQSFFKLLSLGLDASGYRRWGFVGPESEAKRPKQFVPDFDFMAV